MGWTAFDRPATGKAGYYVTMRVPWQSLHLLTPNHVLEAKFTEGYRAAMAKLTRRKPPADLYRVAAAVRAVRVAAANAARGIGQVPACGFHLTMSPGCEVDDDGWIFLVKPVLDGFGDAGLWRKDRRRIAPISGEVLRDGREGGVLTAELVL